MFRIRPHQQGFDTDDDITVTMMLHVNTAFSKLQYCFSDRHLESAGKVGYVHKIGGAVTLIAKFGLGRDPSSNGSDPFNFKNQMSLRRFVHL